MNRKFQRSDRRFSMSCLGAVAGDLAVVLAGGAERLVELLQEVDQLEVRRRLERIVVAQERQRHPGNRQPLAARRVVHRGDVAGKLIGLQERGDRHRFLRFLVDHHGHADAAVRMAAAGQLTPLSIRPVDDVGPVGERAHERNREPVAERLADAGLRLHVVRQVRQRVALRLAAFVGDFLVAAR